MPITMENTMTDEAIQEDEVVEDNEEIETPAEDEIAEEEETLVVSIGEDDPDEEEPETAPDWVKDLRKSHREQGKRLKEFEARDAEREAAKDQVEVGDKPSREDYDFDQDDKYEADLIAWVDRGRKLETKKQVIKDEEDAADKRYQTRLADYNTNKAALKVDDFDAVEDVVKEKLTSQQQAIAIHALEKPELFMLAVGKNTKVLDRLSEIKDPVIFAVEIGKIEAMLKTKKRKAPPPETRLKGTAAVGNTGDKHLDKLERESEKSGNRTEIIAYKRKQRQAQMAT